jgi:hypothetical protein
MKQPLPPHGAPNYDTRENERPDICCECDEDPGICGNCLLDCEQAAEEAAAEDLFEARREAYE